MMMPRTNYDQIPNFTNDRPPKAHNLLMHSSSFWDKITNLEDVYIVEDYQTPPSLHRRNWALDNAKLDGLP